MAEAQEPSTELVQALAPFSTVVGGVNVVVRPGDVYRRTDPVWRASPASFRPIAVLDSSVHSRPLNGPRSLGLAETATAGPGERRTLSRPPGDTPGAPAGDRAPGGRTGGSTAKKAPVAAAAGPSEV